MKRKKFILVRPPRYLWPFVNESDNFLLPLGLPSIAAAVMRDVPDIEMKIIDCPPLKIGWKTLGEILRKEKPDFVGAGEEALYHEEAFRLFSLTKEIHPESVTIAGGHFFSWMVEYGLNHPALDVVVRFEGENTIVDLMRTLLSQGDLSKVDGIAYKKDSLVVKNSLRAHEENLDRLPIAAFELMPMGKYSPFGYLWPQSVTLEHSRGCVDRCSFCSLWTFWGKHMNTDVEQGHLEVTPRYRTKSVARTLEEIDIVYRKYNRKYIIWADPTFNVDPKWTDEFCEGLLKRNYRDLYWWAFLRADYLIRDERLGILKKMVKGGLIHPLIGIERGCSEDFKKLDKSAYTSGLIKEVFDIFRRKYPQVFRQGTFVTCLPFDTRESMLGLVDFAKEIDIDYPAFHPIAPVPGTVIYKEAKEQDLLEEHDFKRYDWATPLMRSYTGLSRQDFADLNMELNKRYVLCRPFWLVRGLFSPYKHKRSLYWWFFRNTVKVLFLSLLDTLLRKKEPELMNGFRQLRKPLWYDS